MIIILEGTEGGGKSTLAARLSLQNGYRIRHFQKPNNEEERNSMHDKYIHCLHNDNNMIYDRCWYSEMVYGPIMRDQSYIDFIQMYEYEMILANKGAIIIHCTDDPVDMWKRAHSRGESYVMDIDTLDALREGYEKLFHKVRHHIPVVRYELSKNLS